MLQMDGTKLTKEEFLSHVKDFTVKIIKNDGLYRHLECSNDGNFNQRFAIMTWPGYLAYSGDMGDYVFSRIDDMFCFFRNDKMEINTGYWAEKVTAESVYGHGIREFSVEAFRENVLEYTRSILDLEEDQEIPEEMLYEIRSLLRGEDEYECVTAMRDFESDKIEFTDFWECSCNRKTYHYVWCCYALVWAISQYDKLKEAK